jgi:hypothetical protein
MHAFASSRSPLTQHASLTGVMGMMPLVVCLMCLPILAGPALAKGKFEGRACGSEKTDCRVACVAWQNDPPGSLEPCRKSCEADFNECIAGGGSWESRQPERESGKQVFKPPQAGGQSAQH